VAKIHVRLPYAAWATLLHHVFPQERDRFFDPDTKARNFILMSEEGVTVVVIDRDSE
jgi:hypothetical protein